VGSTGGIQRFDGVGFSRPLTGSPEEEPSHIYDLAVSGDAVWVGTLEGLWRFAADGETSERFRYAGGELPDDWINAVVVGADGTVWAGTYDHGVAYRAPGGPWRSFSEGAGLPCGWVNPGAMAALPDGSVLVGTLGGGLLRLDSNGLLDHWTMADGLAGDDVTSIAIDGLQVHVGTRSGLSRLVLEPTRDALADGSRDLRRSAR
jgi:ligand-binding sensor domain-containing protein